MSLEGVSSLILALVGVGGLVTSYYLSKRGARTQEQQQDAANKLAERVTAFDELESINDRLKAEIERCRTEIDRLETVGQQRLVWQSARCRARLDDLVATVTALQGVVVSELARSSADDVVTAAREHIRTDHPEEQ